MSANSIPEVFGIGPRGWIYVKLGVLLAMMVLLWIPLSLVDGLVRERQGRQQVVTAEIGQTWGGRQTITGPILVVPYLFTVIERVAGEDTRVTRTGHFYVLPEHLRITARVAPELRYRGIFKAPVYRADLGFRGRFAPPDLRELGLEASEPQWDKAVLAFSASDLRGVPNPPRLDWAGTDIEFRPGTTVEGLLPNGLHGRLPPLNATRSILEFAFDVSLAGGTAIAFTPAAKMTEVTVSSSWNDPSFGGAYLPHERSIAQDGFTAAWRVTNLAHGFPLTWSDSSGAARIVSQAEGERLFAASRFEVTLAMPVSFYQQVERSVKYGLMFIAIVMAAMFLFERAARQEFHLLQYGLVGLALCLFFLMLLALAEVLGFASAYALAAASSTLLISWYVAAVLQQWRRGATLAAVLAGTYAELFVILQLEEWALLAGALTLFATLFALMYATRRFDWLTPELRAPDAAAPARSAG